MTTTPYQSEVEKNNLLQKDLKNEKVNNNYLCIAMLFSLAVNMLLMVHLTKEIIFNRVQSTVQDKSFMLIEKYESLKKDYFYNRHISAFEKVYKESKSKGIEFIRNDKINRPKQILNDLD
jgi:hypothetical protein